MSFREFTSSLFHRTEFQSCFLFRGIVRSGIPRGLLLFFVQRKGFPSCFLLQRRVRNGIPRISVPLNCGNSVRNNHLFRPFRLPQNYFLSEIPNHMWHYTVVKRTATHI
jgi:hypothetical protein